MPTTSRLWAWGSIVLSASSLALGLRAGTRARRRAGILAGGLLSSTGLGLLYATRRPEHAPAPTARAVAAWTVIDDGAGYQFADPNVSSVRNLNMVWSKRPNEDYYEGLLGTCTIAIQATTSPP